MPPPRAVTPPARGRRRRRSVASLAAGAMLVAALGAMPVYRAVASWLVRPADSLPTTVSRADPRGDATDERGPAVTATPPRRVKLVVVPPDALAEIDAVAAPVIGGLVEVRGPLGSVHSVRLRKGLTELAGTVIISEEGAVPPKLELGAAPAARATPTGGGPPASPLAPTSAPAGPRIHRSFE